MPYWRLSGFYFFYFASLGALLPYWSLYLHDRGFTPVQIGELMAVLMVTKLIAPPVWGWIADHQGKRMPIVRTASLFSILIFSGVFLVQGYWLLAAVMLFFSFFWNASLPQFEAVTLSFLGEHSKRYSLVRLWGSIGFILTAAGLGQLVERYGIGLTPVVIVLLYVGIWLNSLIIPDPDVPMAPHSQGSIVEILKRREVLAFMAACFLMQVSHGTYYAFYSLFMEQHGYSSSVIGWFWAIGVVAEVLVFLVMHHILHRWGAVRVLTASLLIAVVRWLLVGLAPEVLPLVILSQIMHAATFGAFHAAAIHFIHHAFVGKHQGRGQALYSSISFGAGGAAGSLLSGYLWASVTPYSIYLMAAGSALIAVVIALRWLVYPTGQVIGR